MNQKIPPWLWIAAFLLSWSSGSLNGSTFLHSGFVGVSHITGNLTLIGLKFFRGDRAFGWFLFALLFGFFLGGVLSGIFVRNEHFQIGRRYGVALFTEAWFLALAFPIISAGYLYGYVLVSAALGLQNAMVTTFSGAIVRTTHMTGILTDFGAGIGNWISGRKPSRKAFFMQFLLLSGFLIGAISSWPLYNLLGLGILLFHGALSGLMGFLYLVFVRKISQKRSG